MVMDQRTELHRLCEALKKDTVGLLLGWQDPVSLKIRDSDNKTIVNLNASNAAAVGDAKNTATVKPRSAQLSSMLSVMTQAGYITIDDWSSWVPASASTTTMSIKGAMSLEPSPNKNLQLISFGLRPLTSGGGHNELYDHVNRLFAQSSFGAIEDDVGVDDQEKLRRQSDKRFKSEGYTNRQLKARKGVDRYPMFHLRIFLKDRRDSDSMHDRFIEDEGNLQAILAVFGAMIRQWLVVHHFRPRQPYQKLPGETAAPSPISDSQEHCRTLSRQCEALSSSPTGSSTGTPRSRSVATLTAKKQRVVMAPLENLSVKPRQQAFADWSRIKSGKSSFFDSTALSHGAKMVSSSHEAFSSVPRNTPNQAPRDANHSGHTASIPDAKSRGALGGESAITTAVEPQDHTPATDVTDGTVLWTDPSTQRAHILNARTGCVVPLRRSLSQADSAVSSLMTPMSSTSRSFRVATKPTTAGPAKMPWLDGLLQRWDNPVFKPSERGIQQISLHDGNEQEEQQRSQYMNTRCSYFDMHKAFDEAGSGSARLSKEALRTAQVVSQVDKKFILAKMGGTSARSESQSTAELLVLIDQHAADERIRVESLLAGLCNEADVNPQHSDYQSKLGLSSPVAFVMLEKPLQFVVSSQEHVQFELHAAGFAAWGILYVICISTPTTGKDSCRLTVETLPPSISERCKADPQLLISFLRSAVWKYADSPPLAPAASSDQTKNWVQRIATCPPGLVDMINSRACRSAIMFNDELSLEECKTLVSKLADCVFPFMCAHGRPSMVPIVDLGKVSHIVEEFNGSAGIEKRG